ncbi:hypothetical protein ACFC18_05435 [Streptomyces sp. NPDC056121]|uniref:hypothetical protein n=1 Tax=unclassified Streptomyces TaxID=2593676 RepID=UPI0035E26B60
MGISRLTAEAWKLTASGPRVLLGIAGPPGAGKSTLARALLWSSGSASRPRICRSTDSIWPTPSWSASG